jgi:hypothetical protein
MFAFFFAISAGKSFNRKVRQVRQGVQLDRPGLNTVFRASGQA